jgi:hypothetical protein
VPCSRTSYRRRRRFATARQTFRGIAELRTGERNGGCGHTVMLVSLAIERSHEFIAVACRVRWEFLRSGEMKSDSLEHMWQCHRIGLRSIHDARSAVAL